TSAAAAFQDGGDDLGLSCPVVAGDAGQCVGHLVGRQVGGAGQHVALRSQEGGGRPAPHVVALIDVRPDIVVDAHRDVLAVDQVDDLLVRVRRLVHDVAPVAPDGGDRQQDGLVLGPGALERLG